MLLSWISEENESDHLKFASAEIERIEVTIRSLGVMNIMLGLITIYHRRYQKNAELNAAKRQLASVWQKEAEAKAAKQQGETEKQMEDKRLQYAQAKAAKQQSASV